MTSADLKYFGKHFLVEPSGTELSGEEIKLLEQLQPAAIMFRKRNFLEDVGYDEWLEAYRRLVSQIRSVLKHDHLMIAIDHEGGRVIRPPLPITRFPYAARFGNEVAAVAEAMAVELKSLGVNVNFAPVADIHSNPDNPVINERAFACNATEAARASVIFAKTLMKNEISPCAKHFPGHGDTKKDSHYTTPVLDLSLDQLRERELVPFQALIDAGVDLVMTAHIVFPQIDPENQATMSMRILNGILREEMKFKGVIIADALGMAATILKLSQRETVSRAINAGLDLFCLAGDTVSIEDGVKMAKLMVEALVQGEISRETLDKSQARIDDYLRRLPQHNVERLDDKVFERHHKLADKLSSLSPWSAFNLSLPGFE
ncbi:MAG: hypothetical protein K2X93_29045 [Candidatus Obscuribacterales bacterium]|nr:hypothetical protein [Candidatus Obscuribacterales bacterium]